MLPPPRPHPFIDGPMAAIALRPTLDRWAPSAIARLVLPMQRILAVATLADGDQAVFAEKLGLTRRPSRRILAGLADRAMRRRHFEQASRHWESLFFNAAPVDPEVLVTAELARRDAAVSLLSGGREFLEILRRGGLPVEALPPDPSSVLGATDPLAAIRVETSHPAPGTLGTESWVRFPAPTMGDQAWARVYEPADGRIKATMIFLHGIAMETEFWPDRPDPINALTQASFRVLRPEGPWHGRRRLPGQYGGEPAFARAPTGLVELIEAWVAELRTLIAWCRQTQAGPVVLGGVSLGALASQWAATAARDWAPHEQPDFLFLVATSGGLADVALHGSLARAMKIPERLQQAGWDRAALAQLAARIEPCGAPVMDARRVVMLLGDRDDLTPFDGGLDLARRWAVPAENLFVRPFGHFSVALRLSRDPAPLQHLVRCVTAVAATLRPGA